MTRVGILGLGYVGLPLAVEFARAGADVVGLDVDAPRVARVSAGCSDVEDVADPVLAAALDTGRLRATTDAGALQDREAIILCLPTPLDAHRTPDLTAVMAGARTAVAHLAPGALLVLESTTYPGTTREVLAPMLEQAGRRIGEDVFLAFSPERVDPGNPTYSIRNTPKVVGGMTPRCTERARDLYAQVCQTVHVVSTPESAELSKLIENTFRAVNIALVNELAVLAHRMGIDIWEAIDAAATKPFGYQPFWPGPGLGGHCIPVDPFYLSWRARAFDLTTEFVELAGRVNRQMPWYAAARVAEALNDRATALRGAEVLLLGVAYKADVGDVRESPAVRLAELLRQDGARVAYHDPHVPRLDGLDLESVPLTPERIAGADCVVIATAHRAMDLAPVVTSARLIVDLRNAVRTKLGGGPTGPVPGNVVVL
jgi:UDP-N-acetyl-D-glucosamine dehydrogenase